VNIDFSDYASGAGIATDLVNTSPEVRKTTGEVLTDPAALGRFLEGHGIAPDDLVNGGRPDDEDLEQVHTLRAEVRAIIEATTEEEIVAGATALVTRAAVGPVLRRGADDRWEWYVATSADASLADKLAVRIGTGLLGVVRSLSRERFRLCASPVCDGVFVDTSRAGRRRYCMPELCGNRLNVANYRARQLARRPAMVTGSAEANPSDQKSRS